MSDGKVYDLEYKIQAVKLANEIGQAKAATELGIPRKRSEKDDIIYVVRQWRCYLL